MEREERRKRIITRGTDRMALITGRIENLNPDFSKSYSFNSPRHDYLSPMHARTTSEPIHTNIDHNKSFFQDHDHHHPGGYDSPDTPIKRDKPPEETLKRITSENKVSTLQKIDEKEQFSTNPHSPSFPDKQFINHILTITPKEIHSSIVTSEDTRVICSIVVAILVVLSHVNLPHNVVKSKSLIAYRPLYVVLLTDVLIVCARLALYSQCREEEDEKETRVEDDVENWGGAVKLLEWGLVVHQAVRGVFIDCSFYVAIVVIGLSIV